MIFRIFRRCWRSFASTSAENSSLKGIRTHAISFTMQRCSQSWSVVHMTWFTKFSPFIQAVAHKLGYIPPPPEILCDWDALKCHYEKLKPVFDICKDNACVFQNLIEYGSKYDKSVIFREFSKNYLPYIAVATLATTLAIGLTIRQCKKGKKRKTK